MRVLVTGAGGVLGKRVLGLVLEAEHDVSVLTHDATRPFPEPIRVHRGDLGSGSGLEAALDGADAVIHCAGDPRNHDMVDAVGTARMVAASNRDTHFIYPGIVGSDVIPLKYYKSKMAAEAAITERPWTVMRSTQFHQLAWMLMERMSRWPVMAVPAKTRLQPIDPTTVARHLVAALETPNAGRLPDLGGKHVYEVVEVARSFLATRMIRRMVVPVNLPGLVGASLRAGGNLTPNRDEKGGTWNDFVGKRLGESR